MRSSSSSSDRTRPTRVPTFLLGRPQPSPRPHGVLDDALLGSAWRWDTDDDRSAPARSSARSSVVARG